MHFKTVYSKSLSIHLSLELQVSTIFSIERIRSDIIH